MVATSTPNAKENKLLGRLKTDYPDFLFKNGQKFAFRPPKTIFIGPPQPNFALLTLHELAHAFCKHKSYDTHIERLKMESEAWERAKTLAAHYGITWDDDFVQSQLDTYRDWLHTKSLCKTCHLTRFQTPDGAYHCPRCDMLS